MVVMGIDHRPLIMRWPVMITSSCFKMRTLYLLKIAMQSSSQSLPREIRVPVWRLSRTNADWAWEESLDDRGSVPLS